MKFCPTHQKLENKAKLKHLRKLDALILMGEKTLERVEKAQKM
jgi:hypothetical protein